MTVSIKSPTSTTGSIQLNGSDVLTIESDNSVDIDSGTLHVDATNNRVGIGTSSPSTTLDITTTGGGKFQVTDWGASSQIGVDTAGKALRINGTTSVRLHTGTASSQSERMRIDSSGNVLVNSTSNVTFGSGAKLYVQGSGTGIAVGYGTATAQYRIMYMNSGDSTLYFHNNSNYAYLNSAGAWTNASDERLKNNIVDIKYGLDAVLNTQPRSYKMNDVEGNFIGFVAQELQTVIPEVVSGDPEIQLGVDYGSLVTVAFKAIQELKAENDTLKSQLSALETRIEALEAK